MATKLKEGPKTPTEKAPERPLGNDMLPKARYLDDPNKMHFDVSTIHRFPEGAECPPFPDHEQFAHGDKSLGLVLDQDSVNVPHIQKGMLSAGYEGLWISQQERRIRHFHATLMGYIEGS